MLEFAVKSLCFRPVLVLPSCRLSCNLCPHPRFSQPSSAALAYFFTKRGRKLRMGKQPLTDLCDVFYRVRKQTIGGGLAAEEVFKKPGFPHPRILSLRAIFCKSEKHEQDRIRQDERHLASTKRLSPQVKRFKQAGRPRKRRHTKLASAEKILYFYYCISVTDFLHISTTEFIT